jgi:sugar/nucleoside kinase (ribokinase family)
MRQGGAPAARVLVVGAASRDITAEDPRGWRLGGAVTYASLALARFGFDVRALVGADAAAATARELDVLRSAGVALALVELESGPVFDNVSHVLHATSDQIPPTALPPPWAIEFDALLLGPVAGEIGEEWAAPVEADGPLVALGWQGLLRRLSVGDVIRPASPRASPLVRAARLVVMSQEDVVPGTRPEELLELLGPRSTLLWTEGAAGGLVLDRDARGATRQRRYPAVPADELVDPTGAGDVFLAAMLATALSPSLGAGLPDTTTFAAAAASLTVEAPGLAGVPDLEANLRRAARAPSRDSRRPSDASSAGAGRPSHD